jgi:thiol-disulfide isomerase/thioredoxin
VLVAAADGGGDRQSRAAGPALYAANRRWPSACPGFVAGETGPCNEEAPSIGKLSARYKKRGLVVLGVNELENSQKAKEFLVKYTLPYTAVVDPDGAAGKDYGALGLPVHIFINRAGVVATYRLGEMNPDEIETAIRGIL